MHSVWICFTVILNNFPIVMSTVRVKIAKIGEKIQSKNTSRSVKVFDDEFFFGNASFKLLVDVDILKVIKGSNVHYTRTSVSYFK